MKLAPRGQRTLGDDAIPSYYMTSAMAVPPSAVQSATQGTKNVATAVVDDAKAVAKKVESAASFLALPFQHPLITLGVAAFGAWAIFLGPSAAGSFMGSAIKSRRR